MDSPPLIPEDLIPEDLQTIREVPAGPISFPREEIARELLRILEGLDSEEAAKQFAAAIQRVDSHERQLLVWWVSDMLPGRIPASPAKRPSLPDAFPQGVGKAWNNPVIHGAVKAISRGGPNALIVRDGWQSEPAGNLWTFQTPHNTGGSITYHLQAPVLEGQTVEKLSATEQLEIIQGFDGLTLDVLIGLMATLCAPPENYKTARYPRPSWVTVDAPAIMKYKDFGERGQDRLLLEKKIEERVVWLSSLSLVVTNYPAPSPKGWNRKKGRYQASLQSRIFHTEPIEHGQINLFGEKAVYSRAWRLMVGSWAEHWWSAENDTMSWVWDISQELLQLPHRQMGADVAKKLALGMFICAGRPLPRLRSLEYTVGQLLHDFIGLPEESKERNNWARRERERLEAAMDLLQKIGILERVEWPDGYGPADVYRGKGWSRGWLAARVVLHPSPPKQEQLTVGGQPQPLLPAPPANIRKPRASRKPQRSKERFAVDGRMARQVRERLAARRDQGLPIYDVASLAKHINISRSHLSNALGGRFHLGKETYQALGGFLKLPQ